MVLSWFPNIKDWSASNILHLLCSLTSLTIYFTSYTMAQIQLQHSVTNHPMSNILSSHCVSLDFRGVNINICNEKCCCVTIFDLKIWWEQLIMRTILHLW